MSRTTLTLVRWVVIVAAITSLPVVGGHSWALAREQRAEPTYEVVIVGAGISGLTAAYFLQDRDVRVLEKEDHVGGRAVSGTYNEFTYAKGAEYLGEPYGALGRIIGELNLRPRQIPSPMDAHYYNGKFHYGEEGLALMYIEHSSLADYNRFVSTMQEHYEEYDDVPEFDLDSELAKLDKITAKEWFNRHSFPYIFHDAFNVAARGLFGASMDEISALSFIPEIAFEYEDAELVEDVDDLSNYYPKGSWETGAYSFTKGLTEITDALARHLGDRIQLSSTVTSVTKPNERYLVEYVDKNETPYTITSDVVILAVPAPIALRLASTLLSNEQVAIMQQIPYSSYVTVALFSDTPIFDQAFDLAVPDGYFFTDIYDSTWVQRYYDPSVRNKPQSVMSAYIAPKSYKDRSLLAMSDEELLQNLYEDLEQIFPGVRSKIVGYDITRFPYAYPIMTLGAYVRLTRLHEITRGGLLLAGDYMIYPTFEAAAQSGHLAAKKAKDELSRK